MFPQENQVPPWISVFQRLRKVNEPKQNNIRVKSQKKWKLKKKRKQFRNFVSVREQNEVEQADQVNVVSIGAEEDTQIFELPCLETPSHQKIATIDVKMCDEVLA